ncbi:MAG: thioredoxin domain-containing protein, partial [Nitrospinales bacterium]
ISSYDGVEPSGNSAAAMAFLRLAAYRADPALEKKAVDIFLAFHEDVMDNGLHAPFMMQALHLYLGGLKEVAVVGPRGDPSTEEMRKFIQKGFFPQAVFAFAYEDEIESSKIPLLAGRTAIDGKAAAYVCRQGTCLPPVASTQDLLKLIEEDYK